MVGWFATIGLLMCTNLPWHQRGMVAVVAVVQTMAYDVSCVTDHDIRCQWCYIPWHMMAVVLQTLAYDGSGATHTMAHGGSGATDLKTTAYGSSG